MVVKLKSLLELREKNSIVEAKGYIIGISYLGVIS